MDEEATTALTDEQRSQLTQLIDEQAVLATLHRYGHSIDYGLEADYLDCYTADGVFEARVSNGGGPRHRIEGREAIARYIAKHTRAPDRWHKHMLVEPVIRVDGNRAFARSYWMRIDAAEGGTPYIMGFGRYVDVLTKEADGKWRFVERVAEIEGVDPVHDSRNEPGRVWS